MNLQIKPVEPNSDHLPLTFSIPVRQLIETIWQKKATVLLIAIAICLALMLGKLLIAPSYTATAVVQVGLLDRDLLDQDSAVTMDPNITRLRSPIMTDVANLQNQESRILASEGLARSVIIRLDLDKALSESKVGRILEIIEQYLPVQYTAPERIDIATQKFMSTLNVKSEANSNLIHVSATGDSPDEAARMANAVVAEYVHYRKAQMLALRKSRAAALIADLSVVYGAAHPNILLAQETLANTETALEAHRRAPILSDAELAATGYTMPALPDSTPSGVSLTAMLFISVALGLIVGMVFVLIDTNLSAGMNWTPQLPKWTRKLPNL